MKNMVKQLTLAGCMIAIATASVEYHARIKEHTYLSAYEDATQCFRQWLLDVDFAEYDKKTGVWKLSDASSIQGNLIKPMEKKLYVNIEDQISSLEYELTVLRKQQEMVNKHKSLTTKSKPDFTKSPM